MGDRKLSVGCGLVLSVLLVLAVFVDFAHAQSRIALVIGNDRYPELARERQLSKAVNDARAVGDVLEKLGFVVIRGENLEGMLDRVSELARKVSPGDLAFFFYAGHGVAILNKNYLLPDDVHRTWGGEEDYLRSAAIAEADVIAAVQERQPAATVVVLDACRENPLQQPGQSRGVGAAIGLARSPELPGVLAVYSAAPARAALDRLGRDDTSPTSLFVRELVPRLARADVGLVETIIDVHQRVAELAASTGFEQYVAYSDQVHGGQLFLRGRPTIARPMARLEPLLPSLMPTIRIRPPPAALGSDRPGLGIGEANTDAKPVRTIRTGPGTDGKRVQTIRIVPSPAGEASP